MPIAQTQMPYPPPAGRAVEAPWGVAVAEGVVQKFANQTERNTLWVTPPVGAMASTTADAFLWYYDGTTWRRVARVDTDVTPVVNNKMPIAGGTFTGVVSHNAATIFSSYAALRGSSPTLDFQTAGGVRIGYIQNVGPYWNFDIVDLNGYYRFIVGEGAGAAEEFRIDREGALTFGRHNVSGDFWAGGRIQTTGSPFYGQLGAELSTTGAIGSLRSTNGVNLQLFKAGGAFVDSGVYVGFFGQTTSYFLGSITQYQGSGVRFNESSDYRIKNIVGEVTDAVSRLKRLLPRRLTYKDVEQVPENEFDGFIAHEVAEVIPAAVTGEKDGVYDGNDEIAPAGTLHLQQLDKSSMIPLVVAALQELIARVELLEAA